MIDWDAIFALVCANLGWLWTEAEAQLDLHRLQALTSEWRRHPPVHYLVASYLDYRAPTEAAAIEEGDLSSATDVATVMPVRQNVAPIDDSAWNKRNG